MNYKEVADLKISIANKDQLLEEVKHRILANKKTFAITPYSEFLFEAMTNPKVKEMLNTADLATPDGIGIFWASAFLEIPLTAGSYYLRICQALCQVFYTLSAVLLYPSFIRKQFPEKIVGADLIWDLSALASKNNFSVYLLGGFGETSKVAANKLKEKFPNLKVAGYSSKNPNDPSVIEEINLLKPDLLFVAYGPIRQEQWIKDNLNHLEVKYAIGLGGTFDYLAGKVALPPKAVRFVGLEWLWRLATQPHRRQRIYNATIGLVRACLRYKVFNSYPFRKNVAVVILNKENQVLVCERNPEEFFIDVVSTEDQLKAKNYWQLPQGGLDAGESVADAAMREAREETGLQNLELIKILDKTNQYTWSNANRRLLHNASYAHKGQVQSVAILKHSGNDNEVKVDNQEFINYRWIDQKELTEVIHPERTTLTEIVAEGLKNLQGKA